MQTILTEIQMRDWAYSWAQRLDNDVRQCNAYMQEVDSLSTGLGDVADTEYKNAFVSAAMAYYEFLKNRFTQEQAQQKISEAELVLKSLIEQAKEINK